jgi:transposase
LAPLAERMTLIDQLTDQIAQCKNYRAGSRNAGLQRFWTTQIAHFKGLLRGELKALEAAIREHGDLSERLDLIRSVDGVGIKTAIAILARMPEIGRLTREQAAALAGLAPYDDDSGTHVGIRHIGGGRERLRASIYTAALSAAFHWNPQLIAFYKRLVAAGKLHKVALIACARKLLIFVNTVVARETPWVSKRVRSAVRAAA